MTELETLERAKMYIDKLANGVDPLTDEPAPENDVINNVRISRCLFYVSDVLSRVINNGGEVTRTVKRSAAAFEFDQAKLADFAFSDAPIGISEIAKRLTECKADEKMGKFSYAPITKWLTENGFLSAAEVNGKSKKYPTESGIELGISVERRVGVMGPYEAILYDLSAQHFIVDNIEAIISD